MERSDRRTPTRSLVRLINAARMCNPILRALSVGAEFGLSELFGNEFRECFFQLFG